MFLEKLTIKTKKEVIREIIFKRGLNLIIDETFSSSSSTDSGNNVGKTTFLRIIDYCLGGNKESIYTEKEFKRKNEILYKFLTEKEVSFELTLVSKNKIPHTILRTIDGKPYVDGIEISSDLKFKEKIMSILFNFNGTKPSLGQVTNKFIRIDEIQVVNALYFLHPTTDHSDYEALFMFLFGFRDNEVLERKRRAVDKVKKFKKQINDSIFKVEDLDQQIHLINKEIERLNEYKKTFSFKEEVDVELFQIKDIQVSINDLKSKISTLALKLEINKESLRKLGEAKTNLNIEAISKLYNSSKIDLPSLNKKFEDVINFHNQMIDNKIKYIKKSLTNFDKTLFEYRSSLQDYLKKESGLLSIISNQGALGEYDKINAKLQDKSREKGNKEGLAAALKSTNLDYDKAVKELEQENQSILNFENQFKENLKAFNIYFSIFSKKLYGDEYYITPMRKHNKTTDNYLLDIGNMNDNIGTGKKKAQISALDLAYLKFSDEQNLSVPLFVLHDQLETVFENQIETLFDLANSLQGQFIVAVLSDKLRRIDKSKIEENCILKLSQNDKLFKIP